MSQKELAIELSKLKVFSNPKQKLEQYPTDSEVAAEILWNARMQGEIEGLEIVDLGCGTGILGIGCLLLGAKKVVFVDVDSDAIAIAKENVESLKDRIEGEFEFVLSDALEYYDRAEVVFTNPPFGTVVKGVDVKFLEHAMQLTDHVYSFHKTETEKHIRKIISDNEFFVVNHYQFSFPLKQTMKHHTKKIERINVTCFRIIKENWHQGDLDHLG